MGWLVAEILLALGLAVFIVWWTVASRHGRDDESRDDDGRRDD